MNKRFEPICESENFIVEYNEDMNVYRVSYFEDNHFVDEIHFDGVKLCSEDFNIVSKDVPKNILRKKVYELCGRIVCVNCPMGRDSRDCPNFSDLSYNELQFAYKAMHRRINKTIDEDVN